MVRKIVSLALLIFAGAAASPAVAYDILAPRLHEAFTQAAWDCWQLAKREGREPTDCRSQRSRIVSLSKLQYNLTNVQREVRWPDDPRREIKSAAFIRPLINGKLAGCVKKINRSRALQYAGQFCASHFGDMQFVHAMSTSHRDSDGKDIVERDDITRAKILDWAAFTYDVATERISENANYCAQFAGSSRPIASAMVPAGFPGCGTDETGWTVGRFFSWRCGSPAMLTGNCAVLGGSGFVKTVATGALLHLVQDSYSQSHAFRTDRPEMDPKGRALPRIECGKPRKYFAYTKATKKSHGTADKIPEWMASCDTMAEADDILTASAMILYHIDRKTPTSQFLAYLEQRVF